MIPVKMRTDARMYEPEYIDENEMVDDMIDEEES